MQLRQPRISKVIHKPQAIVRALERVVRIFWRSFVLALSALAIVAGWYWQDIERFAKKIPAYNSPGQEILLRRGSITVTDSAGAPLFRFSAQRQFLRSLKDMSPWLPKAVVATEDERFYQHHGIDLQGLARAIWVNIRAHKVRQGGSTITMQLARNLLLNQEKTIDRKIKEAGLALQLEGLWSKQHILTAYLNTIFLGYGNYGVEAAARFYFGRPAKALTLPQAASIAGMIRNPNGLDPWRAPKDFLARRAQVLRAMFINGMISQRELSQALRAPLGVRAHPPLQKPARRWLWLWPQLRRELDAYLGPEAISKGGIVVRTTLISALQRRLENALASTNTGGPAVGSSIVDGRNGRVYAVAATKRKTYFDAALSGRRQPGSLVKPFTLATWLARGGQLSDRISNSPVKAGKNTLVPTHAANNLVEALALSQNPVFWRLYQMAGPKRVLAVERALGLSGMDSNPAAALGGVRYGPRPVEIAAAYGCLGTQGRCRPLHLVMRVEGWAEWGDEQLEEKSALAPEYARQVVAAMRVVTTQGFPALRASLGSTAPQLAGKTGTTEDNADAWFAATNGRVGMAVWVGYPSRRKLLIDPLTKRPMYGADLPARTLARVFALLPSELRRPRFIPPRRVQQVPNVVGKSLDSAIAKLQQYRFAVVPEARLSLFARPGLVFEQSVAPKSWVPVGSRIVLSYATNKMPVPNVVGMDYIDALRQIGGFWRVEAEAKHVREQPAGVILEQAPAVGTELAWRKTIKLVVSAPAPPVRYKIRTEVITKDSNPDLMRQLDEERNMVLLPDVRGLFYDDAVKVLQSLGLRPYLVSGGKNDPVSDMNPLPAQKIRRGRGVALRTAVTSGD